jgi:hypothetical protein
MQLLGWVCNPEKKVLIPMTGGVRALWFISLIQPDYVLRHMNALLGPSSFKRQFHLGGKPKNFFESVVDYYMFVSSYGAWPIEIDEITDDKVVAYLDQCTVKCDNHLKLCLAATSMEPRLSKKKWFGANVAYTERIPEGARRCKLVFKKK